MAKTAARKATVCVSRNGATIQVDGVALEDSAEVLADVLEIFRLVTRGGYPELVVDLGSIGGSTCATDVREDEWAEEGHRARRIGF